VDLPAFHQHATEQGRATATRSHDEYGAEPVRPVEIETGERSQHGCEDGRCALSEHRVPNSHAYRTVASDPHRPCDVSLHTAGRVQHVVHRPCLLEKTLVDFDPETYWEERLSADFTLGGVGYRGLGVGFNRWAYRVRRHIILRRLRSLDLPSDARVLDVGAGTGFMIETWRETSVGEIFGCDITQVAVDRLRSRFPGVTFSRIDVASETLSLPDRFDAVSANDVLFHIVEDTAYQRAINNIAGSLKPGGYFVFTDFFRHGDTERGRHWVARDTSDIVSTLETAGLEVIDRQPLFVLMNGPAESGALRGWWWVLTRFLKIAPWAGGTVGAILYGPELALCSVIDNGPSTQMMVCRRVDQAA
jgi:SAM-dependent methyltransferase